MITRDTYEIYIIDYYDGKLKESEISDLMAFLSNNQDLKAEFDLFDNSPIEHSNIVFQDKESLKKTIILPNEISYEEELVIRKIEGDLNFTENNELQKKIQKNPELQKAQKSYFFTKLKPDFSIRYKNKRQLKKIFIGKELTYWLMSSAAAVAILFVSVWTIVSERPYEFTANELAMHVESANTQRSVFVMNNTELFATKTQGLIQNVENKIVEEEAITEEIQLAEVGQSSYTQRMRGLYEAYIDMNDNTLATLNGSITQINVPKIKQTKSSQKITDKYIIPAIKEKILQQEADEKISGWAIGQAVIRVYNRLTSSKVELKKYTDQKGNEYLAYSNENIIISSKIRSSN